MAKEIYKAKETKDIAMVKTKDKAKDIVVVIILAEI
jgi:hypothetical protein